MRRYCSAASSSILYRSGPNKDLLSTNGKKKPTYVNNNGGTASHERWMAHECFQRRPMKYVISSVATSQQATIWPMVKSLMLTIGMMRDASPPISGTNDNAPIAW